MTSTEFTIGLEGGRNSSKVLKPPGGGTSDIFGIGANSASSKETAKVGSTSTQSRLFGNIANVIEPPAKVEVPPTPASVTNKPVRRNPITGEGFEISEKKAVDDEEKFVSDSYVSEKAVEQPKTETPKAVQTSIRVRNPPGGKSSGIF